MQDAKQCGMCECVPLQSRHTWFVIQYLPFPPSVHHDGATENLVSVTGPFQSESEVFAPKYAHTLNYCPTLLFYTSIGFLLISNSTPFLCVNSV